jgi:hypothetical protein
MYLAIFEKNEENMICYFVEDPKEYSVLRIAVLSMLEKSFVKLHHEMRKE